MSSFKKLNTKIYQKSSQELSPDSIYWKQFHNPVLVKEFGAIDYIDFSPIEPYYFAVTCSVRVQVYNPITKLVIKNLSRFRENAYGAVFRSDGRLLCAGSEERCVKLFDVATKSLLRLFKGHDAAVHRTFFVNNEPQIVSFSDDKTVKLWDIPTENVLKTYDNVHTDYIRAGAVNPIQSNIIVSGSYDNHVNLYDLRTANQSILRLNHQAPIEFVQFLKSGTLLLTCGGTEIKIWDLIQNGRLLGNLTEHHKTITCLRTTNDNRFLLSSSLDRNLKIYDLNNFKVVNTINYTNAILNFNINKNNDIVAGLTDGLIVINRKMTKNVEIERDHAKIAFNYKSSDMFVNELEKPKETKYDHHLRKFQYMKALESVLINYVINKQPEIIVTLLRELIRRKAFKKVIDNCDAKIIKQLLRFFVKYLTDYRFTKVLIDCCNILLNSYEERLYQLPTDVVNLFVMLANLLKDELKLLSDLGNLNGSLVMLLSANTTLNDSNNDNVNLNNLKPSTEAQKNLIVSLI